MSVKRINMQPIFKVGDVFEHVYRGVGIVVSIIETGNDYVYFSKFEGLNCTYPCRPIFMRLLPPRVTALGNQLN